MCIETYLVVIGECGVVSPIDAVIGGALHDVRLVMHGCWISSIKTKLMD
jgi:hypothetical protein